MNELFVVGMGPGSLEQMTYEAVNILKNSDLIVGYQVYINLLKKYFPQKEYFTTGMTQETERIQYALEQAQQGRKVSVVSSGDSGVYGMAGLTYELAEKMDDVKVTVISGVTAALSGSAILGAPLMHDFAVISLSDRLTEWDLIEKRLRAAGEGDFVLCIYNPSSRKRHDYLQKACDILLQWKKGTTVCGIVRNIGREGQEMELLNLQELRNKETDMFTTIMIGNSQTRIVQGKMVTPRGYLRG